MTQPFALGGEDGVDKFDPNVKYRSCLQNYLIDTGDEVILVDTGVPAEFPDMVVDETTQIFIGSKITDYTQSPIPNPQSPIPNKNWIIYARNNNLLMLKNK